MIKRLVAVIAALSLAGCTSLPTTSDVVAIDPDAVTIDTEVDFLPPGPTAGASPQEIIQGFIAAGAAAQNNFRVARSYLTDEFREVWNPNQSALISGGAWTISSIEPGQWLYTASVVASVDEAGRYEDVSPLSTQELVFKVSEVDGQWRISEAPDGIMLSELAFRESFESVRLYYYSADYRELVPDVRWFASRGDVLTKVIRGLLQPPSYWLNQGATVSAFPPGTQLALSPVPVVEGQAQVDLSESVLDADEVQRERMLWQLITTLQQLSDVSDVAVTVNQTPLAIPVDEEDQPVLTSGRDPRVLVVRGSEFGYLQSGRVESIEELEAPVLSLRPQKVFFSAQSEQAAVVGEGGLWRVDADGVDQLPLDQRENLVRPIIDSCGFTWSMNSAPGDGELRVFPPTVIDPEVDVIPIEVELPAAAQVVSFELARDNTRLMLLVQGEGNTRVLLSAVQRQASCEPVALGEFLELSPLVGDAVDAAFVDESQVAVVARQDSAGEVVVQDVSGRVSNAGRPVDPVALVGGVGGVPGLRLMTELGQIYQPRGNGWQATGDRATVLVTQR